VRALLQRVSRAAVAVGGRDIAAIEHGLLVFLACERGDQAVLLPRLLARVLGYRIFPDAAGRMNRNVVDADGSVLLVPQFTLAADTGSGLRPSFTPALPPADAAALFEAACRELHRLYPRAAFGNFGADMQVTLTNDGPVTFLLEQR
jgi:D-aminoacyl-tRNA deacylase